MSVEEQIKEKLEAIEYHRLEIDNLKRIIVVLKESDTPFCKWMKKNYPLSESHEANWALRKKAWNACAEAIIEERHYNSDWHGIIDKIKEKD